MIERIQAIMESIPSEKIREQQSILLINLEYHKKTFIES